MARRPWIDDPAANINEYIKKQPSLPAHYNLAAQLDHWRQHGIVIFEQAVDPDLIDELLEDIEVLVRHPSDYEVTVDLGGGNHVPIKNLSMEQLIGRDNIKINNLHFISKAAIRCALNKFAASFLTHVFQDMPCMQQSLFFIRGSQQPIHLSARRLKT